MDIRSNIALHLCEFPRAKQKDYIWPCIPRLILIRIQYQFCVLSVYFVSTVLRNIFLKFANIKQGTCIVLDEWFLRSLMSSTFSHVTNRRIFSLLTSVFQLVNPIHILPSLGAYSQYHLKKTLNRKMCDYPKQLFLRTSRVLFLLFFQHSLLV